MRRLAGLALALTLAACAPSTAPLPGAPVAAGPGVAVTVQPLPLNPQDPAQTAIGDFAWAGGVAISSTGTSRLHGLSDLAVTPDGRLTAVSDEGDLVQARIVLDRAGRLTGLADVRIAGLSDPEGKPVQGKQWGDAEGLAVLPNGDRLISFEQRHRVWLYPAAGGPPRAVPSPDEAFPENGGMEAIAALGPDRYAVGGEDSGRTWTCGLAGACTPGPGVEKPAEFGLVAMAPMGGARMAHLLRAWDPARGNRVTLTVTVRGGEVARLDLARPLTIDNFEGLAALPGPNGATRFYLLSDDNFSSGQRTLLVAFDWKPGR